MIKQAQTIEFSTELDINYIPCCKIVLMFYNLLLKKTKILTRAKD